MTKYLSVLLFLLSAIAVGAQPTWPPVGEEGVDFNLRNSKGKKTGLWYRTYSDGGLYYAGEFENDRPKPGTSLYYYYENGHPMATHKFRPDAITVDAKHYYSSGILQSQGKYVEQKKDSTWKFYDEKGLLRSIENYKEDSLHGKKEIFYPGGQLLKEEIYDFGTPIGKFTEYYDNGNPRTVGHWEAGKFGGDFIYYYSNGKKESEGKFANDLRDGQWLYWLKDGQLQAQVLYRAGKIVKEVIQNGERVEYYPSGIPKLECNYKNGVLHGIYTEYYD